MTFATDFRMTLFSFSAVAKRTFEDRVERNEHPSNETPVARHWTSQRAIEFSLGTALSANGSAALNAIARALSDMQAQSRDHVVVPAIVVEGHFAEGESAETGFQRAAVVVDALRDLKVDTRFVVSEAAAENLLCRCVVVRVMG